MKRIIYADLSNPKIKKLNELFPEAFTHNLFHVDIFMENFTEGLSTETHDETVNRTLKEAIKVIAEETSTRFNMCKLAEKEKILTISTMR
jgi:molybdenum cofactor biosynthesis enzyme